MSWWIFGCPLWSFASSVWKNIQQNLPWQHGSRRLFSHIVYRATVPFGSRAIAMDREAPSRRALLRRRARARAAKQRKLRALQRLCLACRVMIAIRRWRRNTFKVDPLAIKRSNSAAIEVLEWKEDSDLEIAIYEEGDIYEEILNQFQSLSHGMPLEWPQSKREMTHRALHFAIAEREALSLELTRLRWVRWEVLVVKLLWWSKEFVVGMRWLRPFRGRSWTAQSICYFRGILHGKHLKPPSQNRKQGILCFRPLEVVWVVRW